MVMHRPRRASCVIAAVHLPCIGTRPAGSCVGEAGRRSAAQGEGCARREDAKQIDARAMQPAALIRLDLVNRNNMPSTCSSRGDLAARSTPSSVDWQMRVAPSSCLLPSTSACPISRHCGLTAAAVGRRGSRRARPAGQSPNSGRFHPRLRSGLGAARRSRSLIGSIGAVGMWSVVVVHADRAGRIRGHAAARCRSPPP